MPRTLRVLVADDNRDFAFTLMMLLRHEGHDVRGAFTGRQVMDSVSVFDPDALVLDIALPDISGWDIARHIRQQRKTARPMLIGVSGAYKQGADKVLSEMIGFDHYLIKPCDPSAVIALLRALQQPSPQ